MVVVSTESQLLKFHYYLARWHLPSMHWPYFNTISTDANNSIGYWNSLPLVFETTQINFGLYTEQKLKMRGETTPNIHHKLVVAMEGAWHSSFLSLLCNVVTWSNHSHVCSSIIACHQDTHRPFEAQSVFNCWGVKRSCCPIVLKCSK